MKNTPNKKQKSSKKKNPENAGITRDEKGRFPKGVSGNPAGKPPGSPSITARIKAELMEVPEGQKFTYLEMLVKKILHNAIIKGDARMIEDVWNYVDGMPKASIDLNNHQSADLTPEEEAKIRRLLAETKPL